MRSRAFHQGGERSEARLRGEFSCLLGCAQHPEDPPHLAERLLASALDLLHRLIRFGQIGVKQALSGLALHDHRADTPGDHGLQLTRDPGTLVRDREPLTILAFVGDACDG